MLEMLKNGSGIHIKKKNRGRCFKSFNKYVNICDGIEINERRVKRIRKFF